MQTLIAAVAFVVTLSLAPKVSADWQYEARGVKPEQAIGSSKAASSANSVIRDESAETEAEPYSILGAGPITGWQTLSPMTLEGAESPTAWQFVQARVGMGEGDTLWLGFAPELEMFPTPEV